MKVIFHQGMQVLLSQWTRDKVNWVFEEKLYKVALLRKPRYVVEKDPVILETKEQSFQRLRNSTTAIAHIHNHRQELM